MSILLVYQSDLLNFNFLTLILCMWQSTLVLGKAKLCLPPLRK